VQAPVSPNNQRISICGKWAFVLMYIFLLGGQG
jgi:hypothetical protein